MIAPAYSRTVTPEDPLTGLLAPDEARRRLDAWCRGNHDGEGQAMLIALQRFQSINRAFGTAGGDRVLAVLAQRLRAFADDELDGDWLLARIGGSEFLMATRDACSRDHWTVVAEAAADTLARPLIPHEASSKDGTGDEALRVTPRIALAGIGDKGAGDLLDALGHALAQVQSQPGLRLQWVDEHQRQPGRSIRAMEADLLAALGRGEIAVLFQPQFAVADGHLLGAEALARWEHPELGQLGAATLFAVAERADLTSQLSEHIARTALMAAAAWPVEAGLRLSLNLTAADFASGGFPESIEDAVAQSGFAFDRLTLEVTEQALLVDLAGAAERLERLARRGVRVALDDFGTGFSNFQYLKVLPLDYLKLDHSLTDDVLTDPRDRTILRAIVAMAQALGCQVIAEGVESEAQLEALTNEGCTAFQGFVRAGPLGEVAFAQLVGEGLR